MYHQLTLQHTHTHRALQSDRGKVKKLELHVELLVFSLLHIHTIFNFFEML